MYFEVNGKKAFASTGGKAFDPAKPAVIFLNGSGLDHTFWGLQSRFFAFRHQPVLHARRDAREAAVHVLVLLRARKVCYIVSKAYVC